MDEITQQFMNVTHRSLEQAKQYLQRANGDLDTAVNYSLDELKSDEQQGIETQVDPYARLGEQIIIKGENILEESQAVRDGNIILNSDHTISRRSPWVKKGIIGVQNDGQIDWSFNIMNFVDDHSDFPEEEKQKKLPMSFGKQNIYIQGKSYSDSTIQVNDSPLQHISNKQLLPKQQRSTFVQPSNQIQEMGQQIILVKGGYVHGGCKAVRDGNIILNADRTISQNSPWVKQGIIRVRNDGLLDERFSIMDHVDDRIKHTKAPQLRDKYGESQWRDEQKEKGTDVTNMDVGHKYSINMFNEFMKHSPGLRLSDEQLKELYKLFTEYQLETINQNRSINNRLENGLIKKMNQKGINREQFTPQEKECLEQWNSKTQEVIDNNGPNPKFNSMLTYIADQLAYDNNLEQLAIINNAINEGYASDEAAQTKYIVEQRLKKGIDNCSEELNLLVKHDGSIDKRCQYARDEPDSNYQKKSEQLTTNKKSQNSSSSTSNLNALNKKDGTLDLRSQAARVLPTSNYKHQSTQSQLSSSLQSSSTSNLNALYKADGTLDLRSQAARVLPTSNYRNPSQSNIQASSNYQPSSLQIQSSTPNYSSQQNTSSSGLNSLYKADGSLDGRCQAARALPTSNYNSSSSSSSNYHPSPSYSSSSSSSNYGSSSSSGFGSSSSSSSSSGLHISYTSSGAIDGRCQYARSLK